MGRSESFDEYVSKKLQNKEFAKHYILALMEGEEGVTLEEALRYTIGKMGVKEFSKVAKVAPPNVVRFLKQKVKTSPETLDKFLKPFGLKTKLIVEQAS